MANPASDGSGPRGRARPARGLSRAPKWVPTAEDVLRLLDVVPDRYVAAIWLGAGEGMRLGEVLGSEDGPRFVDHDHGEVHVVQQLRYHKAAYGGFYLAPPKSGSVGDVDLGALQIPGNRRVVGPCHCCSSMTWGDRCTTSAGRSSGRNGARQHGGRLRGRFIRCGISMRRR
jgi:hypothetical protein